MKKNLSITAPCPLLLINTWKNVLLTKLKKSYIQNKKFRKQISSLLEDSLLLYTLPFWMINMFQILVFILHFNIVKSGIKHQNPNPILQFIFTYGTQCWWSCSGDRAVLPKIVSFQLKGFLMLMLTWYPTMISTIIIMSWSFFVFS